jgi:ribosomal protein S18 acetylase RimI-like enzyme
MTESKPINRHIDIIPIAQLPVQYIIFDDEGKEIAGYCLITGNVRKGKSDILQLHPTTYKEAVIWHIYIDPKNRRKAYGRCLVEALKNHYDEVYTQALTDDSKKLLMACGFVREDAEGLKVYRWKREIRTK